MKDSGIRPFIIPFRPILIIQWLVFFLVLVVIARFNYLLAHTLITAFSVVIILFIYSYVKRTNRLTRDKYLLLLSNALLFVGLLDMLNLFSMEGMSLFTKGDTNRALWFWFSARSAESLAFLLIPGLMKRRLDLTLFRALCVIAVIAVTVILYTLSVVPAFYIEGQGVTRFKVAGDYLICFIFLAAVLNMIVNEDRMDPDIHSAVLISLVLSMVSQLLLTLNSNIYAISDMIGYGFKALAFFYIYSGVFTGVVVKPLFRLKESEEILNIEKYKIENLLDSINCGLFQLRPGPAEITFSGSWFSYLGYDENEVPGTVEAWENLIHPEDRHCIDIVLNTGEGELIDLEYRILRKSGEYEYVNMKALYIEMDFPERKELVYGINIIISERKRFEQELISEKHRALELEQLKTMLIDNLSHEIRTPLDSITGFARLIMESRFPQEKRNRYLGIIVNSAEHLTSLISDLTDISNIDDGTFALDVKEVDLNELLGEIEAIYIQRLSAAGKSDISFVCERSGDMPVEIETDRSRLKQVLFNLLNNSVKFTSFGEIRLKYAISDGRVFFSVSDTGIGVDESKRNIIFDRFRQGHEGSNRDFGGIGLGLSIAQELVTRMGGTIDFSSTPGEGSEFRFDIPVTS